VRAPHRGGPRVLAGGRMVGSRQPLRAAEVLRSLTDVAEVRWLGGGPAAIERAVEAQGVPTTGWLPHVEAMAELGRATAYLHWTAADGQSVAILEAVARDVVVVASDIEPSRELLGDVQLCRNESEAAALLRRVVAEPDLRARLLADQRARCATHGAEAMVQGWTDVYRQSIRDAAAGHAR